ncbi:MAG: hypothetical protein HGA19_11540 [Oscillochloris sp.]|nr:hypothetical protein [Oscillochloris sp.]
MSAAEHNDATSIERIIQHLGDDQALARAALNLAAQLLHTIDIGELLSAASIRLELEAAAGNVDALRAAAHIASAGLILYPGEPR